MTITETTVVVPKSCQYAPHILIGLGILFSFFILAINYPGSSPSKPLTSPIPSEEGTIVQNTPPPSFIDTLNLSQNFLEKAYLLSNNKHQSTSDRQNIINNLNQSLSQINSAINVAPRDPRGYLMRARIMTAMSKMNPTTLDQVKKDLEFAQTLSNGQNATLPQPVNPINLIPDEQANLVQNVTVASELTYSEPSSQSANQSSNAHQITVTLPANQIELVVKSPHIKADSYIYLIPQTKSNNPFSLKNKSIGQFTLTSSSSLDSNILIDCWIIDR